MLVLLIQGVSAKLSGIMNLDDNIPHYIIRLKPFRLGTYVSYGKVSETSVRKVRLLQNKSVLISMNIVVVGNSPRRTDSQHQSHHNECTL